MGRIRLRVCSAALCVLVACSEGGRDPEPSWTGASEVAVGPRVVAPPVANVLPVRRLQPPLQVVAGAPTAPEALLPLDQHDARGWGLTAAAIGSTAFVGTSSGALVGEPDLEGVVAFSQVAVWTDDLDAPADPGRTTATARRGDTVLAATDNGWFTLEAGWLVSWEPGQVLDGLEVWDIASAGTAGEPWSERTWIASTQGLFEVALAEDDVGLVYRTRQLTIASELRHPTALLPLEDRVYVAYHHLLYRLDPVGLRAVRIDLPFGVIHRVAAGLGDTVVVACDDGLFAGNDDGWTRYTLRDDGAARVEDLVLDPTQGVFAVAQDAVLRVVPGERPTVVSALPGFFGVRSLALDDTGRLFVAGDGVASVQVGAPVTFQADLAPVLTAFCATCHDTGINGAPVIRFGDYDTSVAQLDRILARVGAGEMPPLGSPRPPGELRELLLRWRSGGLVQ